MFTGDHERRGPLAAHRVDVDARVIKKGVKNGWVTIPAGMVKGSEILLSGILVIHVKVGVIRKEVNNLGCIPTACRTEKCLLH